MKKIKYIVLALIIASVWGCKPEEFGPIVGSEENFVKELQGNWGLTKVTQIDQNAVSNAWPYKELDITTVYPYKELSINIQGEGSGNFTITQGNAPKISDINSGTWTVDDPKYPSKMILKNGAITADLILGSYADLKSGKFYLIKQKKVKDKVIVSYKYEFTKK